MDYQTDSVVQRIGLRMWSRTGQLDCGCDSVLENWTEWSRVGRLDYGCCPELEDYIKCEIKLQKIRLRV